MNIIQLSMNESAKYSTVKYLVDHQNTPGFDLKTAKSRAQAKLQISRRHLNRLIHDYKLYGKASFSHGNKGRKPACAFSHETIDFVCSLYASSFPDASISHYCQILKEDYSISLSSTSVRNWLKEKNILSPLARKKSKRLMKNKLRDQKNRARSKKEHNQIIAKMERLDRSSAHPTRPRSKYMGEMIQMDASSFKWNGTDTWHLHLAVDDASGKVVGAYFDTQETLNGYYHVLYQILTHYGIPALFYTDRRTVFDFKRKGQGLDENDTTTQFSYACSQLGIEIKTTSVPQAKGKIERLNQTFQHRLPIDMRRKNIKKIEEANEFLDHYIKEYNEHFSLRLNDTKSVFMPQPREEEIDRILAVLSERTVDQGCSIHFKNQLYRPKDENGDPVYLKAKKKVLMIETWNGHKFISCDDEIYAASIVQKHEAYSKEFDLEPNEEKKTKKTYIPKPKATHPWRTFNFSNHKKHMHHRSRS